MSKINNETEKNKNNEKNSDFGCIPVAERDFYGIHLQLLKDPDYENEYVIKNRYGAYLFIRKESNIVEEWFMTTEWFGKFHHMLVGSEGRRKTD